MYVLHMPADACEKEIIRLNRILEKPISAGKHRRVTVKVGREWHKLYRYYGNDYEGLRRAVKRISNADNTAVKREFHRLRGDKYD